MLDSIFCCFESRSPKKNPPAPYRSAPPLNNPLQPDRNTSNNSFLDKFLSGNFLFLPKKDIVSNAESTPPYKYYDDNGNPLPLTNIVKNVGNVESIYHGYVSNYPSIKRRDENFAGKNVIFV